MCHIQNFFLQHVPVKDLQTILGWQFNNCNKNPLHSHHSSDDVFEIDFGKLQIYIKIQRTYFTGDGWLSQREMDG